MRQSVTAKTLGYAHRERSAEEKKRELLSAQNFGRQLRHLRVDLGRTQQDLALSAGVDRAYLSEIERGVKSPTLRTLRALARALGLRVAVMLEMCGE